MKTFKRIIHIFFASILIITAVCSIIDMRSEYLIAVKSGEGIEFALLPIVAVIWGVIIISEISLWIGTLHITSSVQHKKWLWSSYDCVTALLSATALCVMIMYRFGNLSNLKSDAALYTLGGAIILHIVGFIAKTFKSEK